MIDVREEYRKNREQYNAKQAWDIAKRRAMTEFEKNLRGFEFREDSWLSNRRKFEAVLDGETYEVITEYDDDYSLFESGEVEQLDKRPYSGQYAREQVIEVGNRRDTYYLVLDEGPKERAKWYSKTGCSRQVAYELASKSCMKSLKYYQVLYEEGTDAYFVSIEKDGESLDACGGIEEDYIEEFVWEQIS